MTIEEEHELFLEELAGAPLRRSMGVPLYVQGASAIERAVRIRPPAAGHPLPPEHELSRALGISRPTLRQALRYLAERGVLHSQRGVGTFAAPQTLTRPMRVTSLYDDLLLRGMAPRTEVLSVLDQPADELTAIDLNVEPDTPLLSLERLRFANERPVALIRNQLVRGPVGALSAEELAESGLYQLLRRKFGIEFVSSTQRVSARLATQREAKLLQIDVPSALLSATRIAYDREGRALERSVTLYSSVAEISATGT